MYRTSGIDAPCSEVGTRQLIRNGICAILIDSDTEDSGQHGIRQRLVSCDCLNDSIILDSQIGHSISQVFRLLLCLQLDET